MHIAKARLALTLLFAATIILQGCSNPDKNKLLFKPAAGSKRVVIMDQTFNQTMKMAGVGINQTVTTGTEVTYSFVVESVDPDGAVTIKVTYDDIKFELPGFGGMPIPGMDSDTSGATDMLKKMQDGFKGSSFTIRVSRLGEVTAIEGAEAVTEKVLSSIGGDADPMMQMNKEMLKSFLGTDTLRAGMSNLFIQAPDKALNPSDAWNDSLTLEVAGIPTTVDSTYTFRGRADGYATIDADLNMKVDFANSTFGKLAGDMKISGDLAGTGKGTYSIDEATGWMTHREDSTTATGKMTMEMPKQLQGMPNMPSSISMDVDMKIDVEITNTAQ